MNEIKQLQVDIDTNKYLLEMIIGFIAQHPSLQDDFLPYMQKHANNTKRSEGYRAVLNSLLKSGLLTTLMKEDQTNH